MNDEDKYQEYKRHRVDFIAKMITYVGGLLFLLWVLSECVFG
jgi:hypothetical protein